ncbi:hypothetical protein E2C01_017679 [Portunus trituberculatus]|uniref:Uncharacterized protein n=1 Tax=Portunus trituberculatus TaxID=210409 RepID=A0A5B7DUE3_PORTR|nr:hypothetical protein [Portunus trituberculatus]
MSKVCTMKHLLALVIVSFSLSPAGSGCAAGGGGRKLSVRIHSSSTSCSNNGRSGLLREEDIQEIHATLTEALSSMSPEAAGEIQK